MSVIEVNGLTFTYAGAKSPAINDVNLEVSEGEFILIVGPSGGGKSTLCRCLNGLIPHFYEGEYKGSVTVCGLKVAETPTHILSQHIGMVFQNPQNQLFSLSVEADIAFPLENLGFPRQEIRARVDEILELLNLQHLKDRSPFELSGGQQQKVAIASVLAMRPEIILLDEPTSFLDPLSALHLFETIDYVRKKLGLTVLIVEHRVDLAAARATRVVLLSGGRVVYDGGLRNFFSEYEPHVYGVSVPRVVQLSMKVGKLVESWNTLCLSPEEFEREVRRRVRGF
jgi:energy-coupling factor transporter ATP-binding protein EcfA2